jgi:Mrp family chromosome partitioning ATPase
MPEDYEQLIGEKTAMPTEFYPDVSDEETQETQEKSPVDETQKLPRPLPAELQRLAETPIPPVVPKKVTGKVATKKITKRDREAIRLIQERCRQLCISLFFSGNDPVRSVGFTSSIAGEGKSFLSLVTAEVLAQDTGEPVTLVECNWKHPSLHEYFGIPATPGLAELLRGSCSEDDIRYQVEDNLTIIPAGHGSEDSMKLLKPIQQVGLRNFLANENGLLVVDLPPILTTGYGSLAASLLESVIIVVHAQITSDSLLAETYSLIKGLPVHGIILNQRESHIPHWLRQIL